MKYLLIILLPAFLLVGCASASKEQCKNANWQAYGERDAKVGLANSFSTWTKTCREFEVVPDNKQYNAGYSKGLSSFCTYETGYMLGNEGKNNPQICFGERQKDFAKGYRDGKRTFSQRAEFEMPLTEPERRW